MPDESLLGAVSRSRLQRSAKAQYLVSGAAGHISLLSRIQLHDGAKQQLFPEIRMGALIHMRELFPCAGRAGPHFGSHLGRLTHNRADRAVARERR
jgi:hypothetical protein